MPWLRSVTIVLVLSAVAAAADWPQFLGPNRDGGTTEKVAPWKDAPNVLWRQPVGEGHGSPVIAGGKVFVFTKLDNREAEELAAFDAATGTPLWGTWYGRPEFKGLFGKGPRATPTVADGKVYTFGPTGLLTCFDASEGTRVWQVNTFKQFGAKNLFFGMSASPLVVDDLVLVNVGAKGASIVAFNKENGKTVWQSGDDAATYASAIVIGEGNKRQAVFLTAQGLVGVGLKDGAQLWKVPLVDKLNESSTTPVKVGDLLIGTSVTFGSLCVRLDPQTGKPEDKPLWVKPELNCYFSTPVAVGTDHLYLVSSTMPGPNKKSASTLRCVDVKTGKELWNRPGVGKFHAALLRTGDNKLLMLEEAGDVVLIDPSPQAYKELARAKVCGNTWAHPALADGRLYVRDGKELVCVELGK